MNVPTPRDTYAIIVANGRQIAVAAAKAEVARLAKERGYHHPDTDAELARLGRLMRAD